MHYNLLYNYLKNIIIMNLSLLELYEKQKINDEMYDFLHDKPTRE